MAITNSINNLSANLTVDPGSSGDSYIQYSINGTGLFRWGVDDDDGDALVLSQGSALGTNNSQKFTSTGIRTLPQQPFFSGYVASNLANVTGNGTIYSVPYTELYDIGSNFSSTTYTAPVTGVYLVTGNNLLGTIGASHTTFNSLLNTSNRSYVTGQKSPAALRNGGNNLGWPFIQQVDMDLGDTFINQIVVAGSTLTITRVTSNFSNYLSVSLLY